MRHLLEASLEIDNIVMHLFCQYRCLSLLLLMMLVLLWVFLFFFSFFIDQSGDCCLCSEWQGLLFFFFFFFNLSFFNMLACRPSNQWIRCIISFFPLCWGRGSFFSRSTNFYIFLKMAAKSPPIGLLWLLPPNCSPIAFWKSSYFMISRGRSGLTWVRQSF